MFSTYDIVLRKVKQINIKKVSTLDVSNMAAKQKRRVRHLGVVTIVCHWKCAAHFPCSP